MAEMGAGLDGASAARTMPGRGRAGAIDPARGGTRPLEATVDDKDDDATGSSSGRTFSVDLERGAGSDGAGLEEPPFDLSLRDLM